MVNRRGKVTALGRQRAALERSIESLATGPEHAALLESARALADTLDEHVVFDDHLWREYRLALKAVHDRTTDAGRESDGFDAEFDALRAEVGNSADAGPA